VLQAIAYEPCSCTEDTTQLVKKFSHVNYCINYLGGKDADLGEKVGYHDHKKEDIRAQNNFWTVASYVDRPK